MKITITTIEKDMSIQDAIKFIQNHSSQDKERLLMRREHWAKFDGLFPGDPISQPYSSTLTFSWQDIVFKDWVVDKWVFED